MTRELFVYYRVAEAELGAALAAAQRFQSQLREAHPALTARLLRRPESRDGHVTLMETYALPGGLRDALARWIAQGAPGLPGPRHVEVFEPL